jgi:hypothetical protein
MTTSAMIGLIGDDQVSDDSSWLDKSDDQVSR